MRPFFVVEDERLVRRGPELERAAGYLRISTQLFSAGGGGRRGSRRGVGFSAGRACRTRRTQPRCRVTERLPRVRERLRMHVLVKDRQQQEIYISGARLALLQSFQDAIAHFAEVEEHFFPAR